MVEREDGILAKINKYSVFWMFITIIAASAIFITSLDTNITEILTEQRKLKSLVIKKSVDVRMNNSKEHKEILASSSEQTTLLRGIAEDLRGKERDHATLAKNQESIAQVNLEVIRVLDRLVITMENINNTMERK